MPRPTLASPIPPVLTRLWPALAVLAALILIARAGSAIRIYSQTIDEPYHIASAVALYETHAHVMGVQHGPLPRLVAGLPLHFAGVHVPLPPDPRKIRGEVPTYMFGADVLFNGPVPYWHVLTLSRWAMLLVFPPLCLLYVYLLGRLLASPRVGAAAVIFFSLDPTLLGHAFWVCTDVAGCAGFLAVLYHGLRWLRHPTTTTALAAGVALGLAISCKFSCILVVPGLLIVALLHRRRTPSTLTDAGSEVPRRAGFFFQLAIITVTAALSLWATYLFAVGNLTNQDVFKPDRLKHIPALLTHLPLPMPSLFLGLRFLLHHDLSGHATYINGHLGFSGHWYYFPEAIALKEPLSVLLAVFLAAVLSLAVAADRRLWRTAAAVLIPAGLFLAVAMHGNLNLGIRHILPVLPCLYLFICLVFLRPPAQPSKHWRPAILLSLILLTAVETVPLAPDYLSYFNLVAGGPAHGEHYLLDSNLDWGQDLARLATWLKSPPNANRPYSIRTFDLQPQPLAKAMGLRPESVTESPHGLFAISLNVSHRLFGYNVSKNKITFGTDYDWVKRYPYVARIGTSFDVYDLDAPPTPK